MKAVGLLSGGLDSTLALRIVKDMGIEIHAINFTSPFCSCTSKRSTCSAAAAAAGKLAIPMQSVALGEEYLAIVRNPPHGYGAGANPCVDCRILKLKKAGEYMSAIGACFLVTGEVVGQRPMSQKLQQLLHIEKEAGLQGLVVRPLSAQALPETIPEQRGWVIRAGFLAITGRSRKPQIGLAAELGIGDYPCPAGGCKLTEKGFSRKVFDLIRHKNTFQIS
ncbi:MAG: hypothetical protein ABIF71_04500 [Planctomycetota bacterium]